MNARCLFRFSIRVVPLSLRVAARSLQRSGGGGLRAMRFALTPIPLPLIGRTGILWSNGHLDKGRSGVPAVLVLVKLAAPAPIAD